MHICTILTFHPLEYYILNYSCTHHEVELFGLLLVGTSLGDAGFAEVRLGHSGLDRLCGAAVVETLRDIVVLDSHHVLDGGQSGFRGLLDLQEIDYLDIRGEKAIWFPISFDIQQRTLATRVQYQ